MGAPASLKALFTKNITNVKTHHKASEARWAVLYHENGCVNLRGSRERGFIYRRAKWCV